jgi:hypothetical protein
MQILQFFWIRSQSCHLCTIHGTDCLAIRGKQVGLLQGAGTQFATWFYAMMHLLCLKGPLKSTIHQQKFSYLDLNSSANAAVRDIEEVMDRLLCSVFPDLRALCYCTSKPSMNKIFFLPHRTTQLKFQKSSWMMKVFLEVLRQMPTHKGNLVWGSIHEDHNEEDEDVMLRFHCILPAKMMILILMSMRKKGMMFST